ncbi:MAG: YqaA family protein [Planctomycetota bacterium]
MTGRLEEAAWWWSRQKEALVGYADSPNALWILFGIAFAESSFFPIPPDILLMALCIHNQTQSFWYALICTAGSVLGGMAGFGIGRGGGRPILDRLFRQEKILHVERQYQKYDVWAVAIAGFTPIPYKVFTISAGVFRLNFFRFCLASLGSRGARFFLEAALFFFCPPRQLGWVKDTINKYDIGIGMAVVAGVVGGFYFLGHHAKKQKLGK